MKLCVQQSGIQCESVVSEWPSFGFAKFSHHNDLGNCQQDVFKDALNPLCELLKKVKQHFLICIGALVPQKIFTLNGGGKSGDEVYLLKSEKIKRSDEAGNDALLCCLQRRLLGKNFCEKGGYEYGGYH
ncbi:MAG: hypothetical protein N2314_08380 [Brevinematales bacterium]|nr:hypothetical protein [Brevinematales bacterium]